MNKKILFQSVLMLSFFFHFLLLSAQSNQSMYVKSLKSTYEWNEKVTVEFSGLPNRGASSNRYDDIIIVPAATPDNKYGEGQRAIVSKTNGQLEFLVLKAGFYEARVYLYEKPGVVSARSPTFQILSVDEGKLNTKSEDALTQIAMRNRSRNKELMCSAISEFFRRRPTPDNPDYKIMKSLQSLCPVASSAPIAAATNAAYPIMARYQCYRILSTRNEAAEDIFILDSKRYKTMNKVGNYTYDAKSRILTFTSGPLFQPSQNWVGVYTGKGEPTDNGGKAVSAMIEIRRKADVDGGNKKVLQQCSCVQ